MLTCDDHRHSLRRHRRVTQWASQLNLMKIDFAVVVAAAAVVVVVAAAGARNRMMKICSSALTLLCFVRPFD